MSDANSSEPQWKILYAYTTQGKIAIGMIYE
jgi:hypothetical protein